jgi:hypothetical protein
LDCGKGTACVCFAGLVTVWRNNQQDNQLLPTNNELLTLA